MSENQKNGGPAFPCHSNPAPGRLNNAPQGMSLRDYFAGLAMHGLISSPSPIVGGNTPSNAAEKAYLVADAMLAERTKKKEVAGE